jgi:hypothetical protein
MQSNPRDQAFYEAQAAQAAVAAPPPVVSRCFFFSQRPAFLQPHLPVAISMYSFALTNAPVRLVVCRPRWECLRQQQAQQWIQPRSRC